MPLQATTIKHSLFSLVISGQHQNLSPIKHENPRSKSYIKYLSTQDQYDGCPICQLGNLNLTGSHWFVENRSIRVPVKLIYGPSNKKTHQIHHTRTKSVQKKKNHLLNILSTSRVDGYSGN